MGLIQTSEQLKFSYQAIIYGSYRLDETNGMVRGEKKWYTRFLGTKSKL